MRNGATMKLFSPLIRPIGVLFRIRRYFDRQVKVAPGLVGTEVPETGQTKDSVVLRKGWYFDIDFDWLTRSLYNEGDFSASFGDSRTDGYFPVQCAGSILQLGFVAGWRRWSGLVLSLIRTGWRRSARGCAWWW